MASDLGDTRICAVLYDLCKEDVGLSGSRLGIQANRQASILKLYPAKAYRRSCDLERFEEE